MMRIQCISTKHCTTQASLFYSKKVDVYARSDVRITMLQGFRACMGCTQHFNTTNQSFTHVVAGAFMETNSQA
ncbi:uncharacterized protein PHALS_15385 [Plasmopara halstedii]|uniref:Uncharacterized protein n=1 Tax=Plasmopara halstedii TaxID=4781 RepID=A0A0P1AFV5_PLAHL|nr:uncharacterized protein PHALS_15385 [Plasmopara halstedii]CEG39413.1 hypothetical protein PHALS_15385 [Plasmopara halstedii]|eukprot:XP_024575782.1 hypothetical protein PHALS_15385 [Plasmopara halstedii]